MNEHERLKRSVQRRQERGPAEIAELLTKDETARKKREAVTNHHSALWAKRQREMRNRESESQAEAPAEQVEQAPARKPLPEGWRNEHWKTLQSMAAEYAGVETGTKAASIAALEAYERGAS